MVVTPDNAALIVAESFTGKLTAFDIAADGSLSGRRVWADLGGPGKGDGICLDAEGAIWCSVVHESRPACWRVREGGQVQRLLRSRTSLAAQRVRAGLAHFQPLVQQVIAQTERRVLAGERVPAVDKLVSLFEPHTAVIRRGKVPLEAEFGRKLLLDEVDGGLVARSVLLDGNPPDAPHLPHSLAHHLARRPTCRRLTVASTRAPTSVAPPEPACAASRCPNRVARAPGAAPASGDRPSGVPLASAPGARVASACSSAALACVDAGHAGASPSRRARGLVTRYTPPSTAKRGRTAEGRPRSLRR
jgi:hypothetical protein